jgi:hypothetical protein
MVFPLGSFVAMQQLEQHGVVMARENPHFRVHSPIGALECAATLMPLDPWVRQGF